MFKTKFRSVTLLACSCMLVATLATGAVYAARGTANADVQDAETYPYAAITSYAPYLRVGEQVSFTATYTYMGTLPESDEEREIYDYNFTWAVTEGESVTVTEDGLVTAVAVGESTLTATYVPDETFAPTVTVDVLEAGTIEVSSLYLNASNLSLDIGGEYDLSVVAVPFTATDKTVTWATADDTVATVENGKVTAVAAGTTKITASITLADETVLSAECEVLVRELDNSIFDKTSLTLYRGVGLEETGDITISGMPENATYEWESSNENVATPDSNNDAIGTITAWNFGSTIITATVTIPAEEEGGEATVYVASANVLVTANYFYGIGFEGQWLTLATEKDASQAGWIFTQVEPGIYQLTRAINAYDGFQIIHGDINTEWSTMLNPYYYDAEKSSAEYVANTPDMFQVNADGVYTILIDLTGSAAKVSITMVSLKLTSFNLAVEEGYTSYLDAEHTETYIDFYSVPENALYNKADVQVTAEGNEDELVAIEYDVEEGLIYVAKTEKVVTDVTNITITCRLGDAYGTIVITLIPTGYVAPTGVRFSLDNYELDLNNGGEPWQTTVHAEGYNDEATEPVISDVVYSTPADQTGVTVDATTGVVSASGFGTFIINATSVVDPTKVDSTTVTVYSSGFYMIGILGGHEINEWNALPQDQDTLKGTAFEAWEIPAVAGSLTQYQADFTLERYDRFSIAFLGMAGSWYGCLNADFFDVENSDAGYFSINDTNIVIEVKAVYTITIDLSGTRPFFTLTYKEAAEDFVEYDQYVILERGGDAWDSALTDQENEYLELGPYAVDGKTETTVSFSFTFTTETSSWPTFQFVTAVTISGGTFYDSYWYGADPATEVEVSGTAIVASEEHSAFFTNGGTGCLFYYNGTEIPEGGLALDFELHFNEQGILTEVVINWATAE